MREISGELGLFATTGFQEDYAALKNGVFNDEQFIAQAQSVLEERLRLLDYAMAHYDDGVLFFYFSSTDLQAPHAVVGLRQEASHQVGRPGAKGLRPRPPPVSEARRRGGRDPRPLRRPRHGHRHERSRLRQFRPAIQSQFLAPRSGISRAARIAPPSWPTWTGRKPGPTGWGSTGCTSISASASGTGSSTPAEKRPCWTSWSTRLEAVRDDDGSRVIRRVYRADQVYSGDATALAPDLIVGYHRGYRASWATCLGGLTGPVLMDNDSAWSADHCADAGEVPGVLFSNRPLAGPGPVAGRRGARRSWRSSDCPSRRPWKGRACLAA